MVLSKRDMSVISKTHSLDPPKVYFIYFKTSAKGNCEPAGKTLHPVLEPIMENKHENVNAGRNNQLTINHKSFCKT